MERLALDDDPEPTVTPGSDVSILLCDPAFRQEPRQIAIALSQQGIPFRFYTSAYFGERSWPFRLARRMPQRVRLVAEDVLLRRMEPSLDESLVTNWVMPDVIRRIARAMHVPDQVAHPMVERWFDGAVARCVRPRTDAVIAMQGAAKATFQRADKLGARKVLIANTPDVECEIDVIRQEESRLGVRTRPHHRSSRRLASRIRLELESADLVLANSDFTRDDLIKHGVAGEKVIAVPLGVDLIKFATKRSEAGRQAPRVALFVGGVHARKGVIYLAEAVQELRDRGTDVVARAIGMVDNSYREVLRPYVEKGILELVGPVPHHRMGDEYRQADVSVFPTLSDGFGLVVLEAMACGVPVIVSDRCGAPVQPGINALVVPHANSEMLGEAIGRVLHDSKLNEGLSKAARSTARSTSWANYHSRVIESLSDPPIAIRTH